MNRVKVDFSKVSGKVKPMHGINNIPYSVVNCKFAKKFLKDSGAPFCRLHDTMGAYGGSHFVDIHNIFPDFTADETDANNYDFTLTDEYISCIQESGCQTFYRLGSTIEWASKKYHIHPPADYQKWARICERIIMHYNYGWADGFEFGIKYWEIWNEPENPPMSVCGAGCLVMIVFVFSMTISPLFVWRTVSGMLTAPPGAEKPARI